MTETTTQNLVTLSLLAKIIGVRPRWLRAEAAAGRIPHLKAGDTILFDGDLVQRILIERARQVDATKPKGGAA